MATSNDLQTCALLLTRMLDKDSGTINTRGGVQPKRNKTVPPSRAFLTTGRIVKGTIASSDKRSDSESMKSNTGKKAVSGKKYAGKQVPLKSSRKDSERCESVQRECKTIGSKAKCSDITKSYNASIRPVQSRLQRTDLDSLLNLIPFNQRLNSSTPSSTPRRLVERDGALMLNTSTGTQVINTTDDIFAARPVINQSTTTVGPRLVRGKIDFTPYPVNSTNSAGVWIEQLPNVSPGASSDFMNINLNNNYSLYPVPESPKISPTKKQLMILQNQKSSDEKSLPNSEDNINIYEASKTPAKIKLSLRTGTESKSSEDQDIAGDREFFTYYPTIYRDRSDAERKKFNQDNPYRYSENDAIESNPHPNSNNPQHLQPSKSFIQTYPYEHLRTFDEKQSHLMLESDSFLGSRSGDERHYRSSLGSKDLVPVKIDDPISDNPDALTKNGHHDGVNVFGASVVKSSTIISKGGDASALLSRLKDIIAQDRNSEINKLISELQDVVQVRQDVQTVMPSVAPDHANELSDNSTSTRDLLDAVSQHFKERDEHIGTVLKSNISDQVIVSQSDSTDLHSKQLIDLRRENDELLLKIQTLQEQLYKVEREKSDLQQVIIKKDEDHLKSLQEKARDIRLVHSELDIIRNEKLDGDRRIARLNDEIQRQQVTIREKDEESSRSQELVRSLHQSTTRLVHDLQNSRSHSTPDCKHVIDTLRKVQGQLDQTLPVSTCQVDGKSRTTKPVKDLSPVDLINNATQQFDKSSNTKISRNFVNSQSTNVVPVARETLVPSNARNSSSPQTNLSPKVSMELFPPSNIIRDKNGVQQKNASTQPNVSKSQVFHSPTLLGAVSSGRGNQDTHHNVASRENSCRVSNTNVHHWNEPQNIRELNRRSEADNDATLTEYDDNLDLDYPHKIERLTNVGDLSSIEQSRHSMTEYFLKYPSDVQTTNKRSFMPPTKNPSAINSDLLKRYIIGSSRQAFESESHPLIDQENSFTVTSCASMDEPAMSIRMSDFSEDEDVYSDELPPHQSSDVDGDYGRLEESGISPIHFQGTPSPSAFFHPVVVTNRSDSVASLSSVTSSEDLAFRDGLASLDANIARIQQQLKAGMSLR